MNTIYLDNAASTPVRKDVLKEMMPFFSEIYANPSGIHLDSQKVRKAIESKRESVADILKVKSNEIYFTSSATEANNIAILGSAYSEKSKNKHIITSKTEHASVYKTCQRLEKQGYKVTYISVDKNGVIDTDELSYSIADDTFLITIMSVNNETGIIQPINKISEIIRNKKNDILFHTDAVQAAGKVPLNINDDNIDLLSLSSHKIYGPKGSGLLFIREGTRISPLTFGGDQEKKIVPGTENAASIIGFATALEILLKDKAEFTKIRELQEYFEKEITKEIPSCQINAQKALRVFITNVCFENIPADILAVKLDLNNIRISQGSACSSGAVDPSRVLLEMGLSREKARNSIRFSFGKDNTKEEIDYVINILKETVNKIN